MSEWVERVQQASPGMFLGCDKDVLPSATMWSDLENTAAGSKPDTDGTCVSALGRGVLNSRPVGTGGGAGHKPSVSRRVSSGA